MTEFKETYNVAEIAAYFKVTEVTVRTWINGTHNYKMNATKVGKGYVISHEELVRYANLMYGSRQ